MKILIFGASGSGTTTLGNRIEKRTNFKHLDADNYYWKKTNPPFQEKVPSFERNKNLNADIKKIDNIVLSGSLESWGKEWLKMFDLAFFIRLENAERMCHLKKREIERYGEKLLTGEKTQQDSKAFLEWANQYENPNFNGRTLKAHNKWIELLDCKVLKLRGETELKDNIEIVLNEIKTCYNRQS